MSNSATRLFGLVATGLFLLIAVVTSTPATIAAPLAAISLGSPYSQNFDTLANTGTTNPWNDDSTIPGWYSNRTVYLASDGSANNGGLYSYGTTAASERALGSLASGSANPVNYAVRFVNDTGSTVSAITVNYTGEQWRVGGTAAVDNTLAFAYQVGAVLTDTTSGTWTPITALDFSSIEDSGTAGPRDGNSAQYSLAVSATFAVSVPAGQEIMLRWQDIDNTSSDHGLAIDNLTVSAGGGGTPTATITPGGPTSTPTATATATPSNACGDNFTPIYAIQGSGAASPDDGIVRTTEGIVVGDYQDSNSLNGFNIQDPTGDGNINTSDGIFVFAASAPALNVGDRVRVTGTVDEYFELTEITNVTNVTICSTANPIPTAVAITLPVAAISDLEKYEGMYVTFPQTLYSTEVFNLGRYGEMTLSVNSRQYNPTNTLPPGPGIPPALDLIARSRILLDDASNIQNPAVVPYLDADNTRRLGDTTQGLTGTLSYGFSVYRVQPTAPVPFTRVNNRPATPEAVGGSVQIASFNVLNFFTTIDNGSNGARGADSAIEFTRQRTKIVEALLGLDADIVGLIELENNAAAIQDLVTTLNISSTIPYTIAPGYPSVIGTDAIKVGIIYRLSVVNPVGTAVVDNNSINNRPTVAQTFEQNGQIFTVVINHFKSKGCGGATGQDTDQGDGQGCFNATRVLQAQRLLTFTNQIATTVGDDDFVLIGDFNAYGMEDPLTTLKNGGYTSTTEELIPEADRYSYVFQGQAGELDHGFVNDDFFGDVNDVTIWNINSDEPIDLDYNDDVLTSGESPAEYNQPYLYQPNQFRASDHDPLLIGLNLQPTEVMFSASDYAVEEANTTQTVTVTLANALDVDVNLSYSTSDGTATAGEDYVATSGTLTVSAGVTTTAFTVTILDDLVVENDETVILTISPDVVPAPPALGSSITATLTIQDNAPTAVDFSAENYTVTEANTTVPITVTLSQPLAIDAVINYSTANGTATAGQDYVATSGALTFTAGTTTQTFNVSVLDDAIIESNETVILEIDPGTLGVGSDVVTSTLTIQDNAPISVDFSAPNYNVAEANTTQVVTVTLSQPLGVDAAVSYSTANGTATAGQDYVAESGTITFTAGTTTKTFDIAILDDADDEPNETFTVQVSPGTLGFAGDVVTATVTIIDNDAPPTAVTLSTLDVGGTATPWLAFFGAAGLLLAGILVWRKR